MSIFAFRVLPLIDDVIQGLALMAGVAFLPSVLRILNRPKSQKLWIVQLVLDIVAFLAQVSRYGFMHLYVIGVQNLILQIRRYFHNSKPDILIFANLRIRPSERLLS